MARFQVKLKPKIIYPLGSQVEITLEIQNKTDYSYYLLKKNLGMDKIDCNCFQVTCQGREAEYDGFLVKREETQDLESYVLLKAGEKLKITFCLAKHYKLERAGFYKLRFNRQIQFRRLTKDNKLMMPMYEKVNCKTKGFWILDKKQGMYMTVGQMQREVSAERLTNMGLQIKPPGTYPEPLILFENEKGYTEEFRNEFKKITTKAHYILAYYLQHSISELALQDAKVRNANWYGYLQQSGYLKRR